MTEPQEQVIQAAIDRAERFAKSPNCTPEEHDDIMIAVRLARHRRFQTPEEGERGVEIKALEEELDRFRRPNMRNLSTDDPITPLPGFQPQHLKGLALLFRSFCGSDLWGRPQEAELAARQVETAFLRITTAEEALSTRPPEVEALVEAAVACLAREVERAESQGLSDCTCINWSRRAEQEYETGACPHQKLRLALSRIDETGNG